MFSHVLELIHCPGNHGQPTLEPPTDYFCPDVNVTYTCHDSNVSSMTWHAEPHISRSLGIQYAPGFTSNESMKKYDSFYSQATNFSVDIETGKFISVTTILTVIASGIENGTNITCLTYRGGYPLVSSSILYFAGNEMKVTVIAIVYASFNRSPSLEKYISDNNMPREKHSSA